MRSACSTADGVFTGIEVKAQIDIGDMKRSAEIKTNFVPDVRVLSTQISDLLQKIQIRARAMLLQEYADRLVEICNSTDWPKSNQKCVTVRVSIQFAYYIVQSFRGNEVSFTLKDIAESDIFEQKTIDYVKKALALHVLDSFAEQRKC